MNGHPFERGHGWPFRRHGGAAPNTVKVGNGGVGNPSGSIGKLHAGKKYADDYPLNLNLFNFLSVKPMEKICRFLNDHMVSLVLIRKFAIPCFGSARFSINPLSFPPGVSCQK
jgi:hypothetical protein